MDEIICNNKQSIYYGKSIGYIINEMNKMKKTNEQFFNWINKAPEWSWLWNGKSANLTEYDFKNMMIWL
jgi:hypothetical protein